MISNLGGHRKKTQCEAKRNAYNADISTMRTSLHWVGRLEEMDRVVGSQECDRYFLWFLPSREVAARHDTLDVHGRHARLNGRHGLL